jgi:hypothetical protein
MINILILLGIINIAFASTMLGDINGDGNISSVDTSMVRQYIEGYITLTDDQKIAADVDINGTIECADVQLIRFTIGQLITLPAMFGDVNGNLQLQSNDTTLVRRFVAGTTIPTLRQATLADVSLDGIIDTTDVDSIRAAIGQTLNLPVNCSL